MPEREPLSGTDNAWRRMGRTENLMTITGVLMFEESLTYDELCDRLDERMLRYERFDQRIGGQKRRIRRPYWESVDSLDIRNHVHEIRLPEPGDQDQFQEFVGRLMSRPLDERRPLWEAYLVDEAGPDEGNAVVVRINHSVGDGFALLYVMLGLVDEPSELEFPIGGVSAPPPPHEKEAAANGGVESIEGPATNGTGAGTGGQSDDDGVSELREKAEPSGLLEKLGMGARAAKTGYDLLTMPDEPETSLYGELGQTKVAGWTRRIDLDRVKEVGEELDATVNDVLLAITAGAVRRVLEGRGEDTSGLTLRCDIPVNLKPMEERTESLGNYFGLVFTPLPIGTEDLEQRIEFVREQMDVRKAGIEAYLMYQLLNAAGYLPESVQEFLMTVFEKQATFIVTNVPGPENTAKFAGKELSDMIFWVPQGNDQGLGISIISYNDTVRVGVAGDENIISDASEMTDAVEAELDELFARLEPA